MDKGVRKPPGFGLQGESHLTEPPWGFRFSPAPETKRGLQAGSPYQGPTRGCWAMSGTQKKGLEVLSQAIVSRRVHFPG